jgi:hypothetical protein
MKPSLFHGVYSILILGNYRKDKSTNRQIVMAEMMIKKIADFI